MSFISTYLSSLKVRLLILPLKYESQKSGAFYLPWEIERCLSKLLVLSVFVVPSLSLDFVREFACKRGVSKELSREDTLTDTVSIVVEEGPLVFKIRIVYEDSDSIAASVPVHVEFSDIVALAAMETLDLNLFPFYTHKSLSTGKRPYISRVCLPPSATADTARNSHVQRTNTAHGCPSAACTVPCSRSLPCACPSLS